MLDNGNSSDWKKRTEALSQVKNLALRHPNEFVQYRSSTHFVDVMCKQINEPNMRVSMGSMSVFLEVFGPLQQLL